MNVRFLDFIRTVNEIEAQPGDRSCLISQAVALAVSRQLPLPSAPVDAPGNYYIFTNLQTAKDMIAELNEQVVFDVQEALEATRQFWMLRYTAAHASAAPVIDPSIGFYDNVLGVARWVDKTTRAFNNQYKVQILALAQVVGALLARKD